MSEQPNLLPIGDARAGSATPTGSRRARLPKPPISTFAKGERVAVCECDDGATEILTVIKVLTRVYVVGVSESDPYPMHYSRTTLRQKHSLGDVRIRKYRDGDEKAVALRAMRTRRKEAALALDAANTSVESALSNIQEARTSLARWEDVRQLRERIISEKATALAALDAEIAAMVAP